MLTFLKRVEIPEYCFLSEIVAWITLGRTPEINYVTIDETGKGVDYRFDWREMPDNFDFSSEYYRYELEEFKYLGLDVLPSFFEAADKCFDGCFDFHSDRIDQNKNQKWEQSEPDKGELLDFYEYQLNKAKEAVNLPAPFKKIVDEHEDKFIPFYELAWSNIFQLLHSGEILIEGINYQKWNHLTDEDEYEKAANFVQLDGTKFALGHDWSDDRVTIDGEDFVALRVRTSSFLNSHAMLFRKGVEVSFRARGNYFVSDELSVEAQPKRGRHRKIDYEVLREHLQHLKHTGRLPQVKENCIYELIVFAEKRFGTNISRTSVQKNLKNDLNEMYA